MTIIGICILALLSGGCNKDLVEYHSNNIRISIEKGDEWLHNFPLFLGINKKNPPQLQYGQKIQKDIISLQSM